MCYNVTHYNMIETYIFLFVDILFLQDIADIAEDKRKSNATNNLHRE